MDTIIAGRFGTKTEADAVAEKMHSFVTETDVCIFHNNPPGQHRTTLFGDEDQVKHEASQLSAPVGAQKIAEADASEQAEKAENTSLATAAVAGVAVGALAVAAGPVAALAAAGVAAYTGSLAGALSGSGGSGGENNSTVHNDGMGKTAHNDSQAHAIRQGGVMIAVRIANPGNQSRVIEALREADAADIEIASGEWQDGDWVDFDPLDTPKLIALH
jgi:hypothetical protein